MEKRLLPVALLVSVIVNGVIGQIGRQSRCEQSSCYPATGDLLIGREDKLFSSSTCGLYRPERFCIVSHLEEEKDCFYCDSRQPYVSGFNSMSHRVENIVTDYRRHWKAAWWQSENGLEETFIQLDLEAEFHFTHLFMRFKTFRPAAMFVERSYDFGKSWKVYRYFAYDCARDFPGVQQAPLKSLTDVICEPAYSDVAPSTKGEVIFRILPPSVEIDDPYSEEVQDLIKMTNLRVNFTRLHTLGDDLLDNRHEIKEKYYYAMYEMVVRGSCSCYGHASRCVPLPGQQNDPNMVHGKCECTHNTKGLNCAQCEDFYNELPWRPARGRESNACKKCECNNHATRCHFDPAVYEFTGRVSGGVCDECQHNTMGRNCEECKPFFFQDPSRRIVDPDVCRPCDCDPVGSEHGGECESTTDTANDLVAGRCICKHFVEGQRCDTCKNGYWNLRPDNPEGCEPCVCHTLGTVGNYGCDKRSGECRCKRYVSGRQCDQCSPMFWGMSEDANGCKPCDCDIGGSYDNTCNSQTGQCNCRNNILGRRCDRPAPGFFITDLDFLVYEGEFATGTGNTRVVIREPQPGRPITWTGPGFMRVSEGDRLEFKIDNIPISMEYDIVIRYEPQMPDRWDDVRVEVIRPAPVDQRGVCANSIPQDDFKATNLPQARGLAALGDDDGSGDEEDEQLILTSPDVHHVKRTIRRREHFDPEGNHVQEWNIRDAFAWSGTRHYMVTPSSCLERGVSYIIRLDFNRYRSDRATPEASVLVDSIVLVPNPGSIPIFQGPDVPQRMRDEFLRFRCRDHAFGVGPSDIPEACKKYIFSIAAAIHDMALDCQCDPTGSVSGVCNPHGGQCECKQNVIGRRCDQCAPGTYGFGPQGCLPCNCNAIGARDNFCDVNSGQCMCLRNVYGLQCDQCQRGFWGFPNCRQCNCNGRADECDNDSGRCLDCRDNTGGRGCEMCASGYYGDPRPGSLVPCRPCMCPGGVGSGTQHASTCRLDTSTNQVNCDCKPGFAGHRCDQCAQNYFGNPLAPGGMCQSCTCNGNIDPNVPSSCDAGTGECLKCLFNTEGFNCERCIQGYFGDATRQNCQACVCNVLGTNRTTGTVCDRQSGQCPCLANVIGLSCDRCAPNYWKIASGVGCDTCECDAYGSLSPQCNQFDGQCECKPGRGGRTCSECENYYWGDPNIKCQPCNCDSEGSATRQCNRRTGMCECIPGVTGAKCDRCARGTTGHLPYCVPCGECFDNWDETISDLRNTSDRLISKGGDIKFGGAPGAFEKEFKEMEDKLNEVRRIVEGVSVTEDDLTELQNKLDNIKKNLSDSSNNLKNLNSELMNSSVRVETAHNKIDAIKRLVGELKQTAEDLKNNATSIREQDVAGAYNSTKESLRRSRDAESVVQDTGYTVDDSKRARKEAEDLIERGRDDFDRKYDENEDKMRDLQDGIVAMESKLAELNGQVCGGAGDCDSVCGGALCGRCGALSCGGAVTKANNALDYAKDADTTVRKKGDEARELLNKVNMAGDDATMAKAEAQMAYDRALEAKNQSEGASADLGDLIDRIKDFLKNKGASPEGIKSIAEEVLDMSISLTPAEIQELAKEINETVKGLTDIDEILRDTEGNLRRAKALKYAADKAKDDADRSLETAQKIRDALAAAEEAQRAAEAAIQHAKQDITEAEENLNDIESKMAVGKGNADRTLSIVLELRRKLEELKRKFVENENNIKKATREAETAEAMANEAEANAVELESKYNNVAEELDEKYNTTTRANDRAMVLHDRAAKLYEDTNTKIHRLRRMEKEFATNERWLLKLVGNIDQLNARMKLYLRDIQTVARFHRECS